MPNTLPTESAPIPAIVLAAGASVRLGQPKQLLSIPESAGETLLHRALRLTREAGASPVFVVLGAHADTIQNHTPLHEGTVLLNPEWQEGMASSLRTGVLAVIEKCPSASGVMIVVCDQPALSAEHLRSLIAAHRDAPETVAASQYAGRYGVPVVLPRAMFPAILQLSGDQGARAILRQAINIHTLEFPGGEWDIDRPEDLPGSSLPGDPSFIA